MTDLTAAPEIGPRALVGTSAARREDGRLTTGTGRFLDDLVVPGMLHLRLVRSPIAHGTIRSVALGLEAGPSVRLFTGEHCRGLGVAADVEDERWQRSVQPLLADGRVRYVGEPVAAVLHPDPYAAEDAAEMVNLEMDELPPVVDLASTLAGEGEPIHESWDGHAFIRRQRTFGDLDQARADGHHVIRRVFRNHRQAGVPLENRGCLAVPTADRTGVTLWSSTQMPHMVRSVVAQVLDMPESNVRVVAPDVGGGFGVKGHVFPEEVLTCWLALQTMKPVKWVEDRSEHLLASIHARDHLHLAEAYVDDTGRVHGIKLQVVVDAGAYSLYPWTAASDAGMVGKVFPGVYNLRNYEIEDISLATNKCPLGTYRGVGRPAAVFTMERLMDEIAAELDLDRLEVRRRNVITEFPYETCNGLLYDPGSYLESMELAAEKIGYRPHPGRRPRAEGTVVTGIGFAVYNEQTSHGARDFALRDTPIESGYQSTTLRMQPDGMVEVLTGLQSHGQSLETTLGQVTADELGVPIESVRVIHGDTGNSPYAMGTWGSRGATLGGASVVRAAAVLREKLLAVAAHLLEVDPGDLELSSGQARVVGAPDSGVAIADLAYTILRRLDDLPPGFEPGLEATAAVDGPARGTFSNACHAVEVSVNTVTGKVTIKRYVVVEDCGNMINPMVVDGQVHGGVAQGIGSALLEEVSYGPDGQPQTSTFMDYLMPSTTDVPPIEVHHLCTPSPWTEGGRKGMGEAGAIGPMAAIASAVSDALGVQTWETPLRMPRVAALVTGQGLDGEWQRWSTNPGLSSYWSPQD